MILDILIAPHPTLRAKSIEIDAITPEIKEFIANLEDTLVRKKNPEGVGLSAPQLGKSWRIFSTFIPGENHVRPLKTFINPVITKSSKQLTLGPNAKKPYMEGCLSIPKYYGPVWRHQWLTLTYQTYDPTSNSLIENKTNASDFDARVIQHELDHLNGILFTDHVIGDKLPLYIEQNGELVETSDMPRL
jgi:peptide deformylase